ncbi:MAG: M28 family peptidase [bacterium]
MDAGGARAVTTNSGDGPCGPVTGEEMGLLGSSWFAEHPTVPEEAIVANVNIDMVLILHPLHDVIAFGAEHSTLAEPLERAARHLGIDVSPDPWPEEVIFVRSDQYSFVRKGIPALFPIPGAESGSPDVDGPAREKAWRSDIYHTPKDDLGQEIVWETGAAFARLVFLLTSFVADAPERPVWNEGDFFGELFGGPMVKAGPK